MKLFLILISLSSTLQAGSIGSASKVIPIVTNPSTIVVPILPPKQIPYTPPLAAVVGAPLLVVKPVCQFKCVTPSQTNINQCGSDYYASSFIAGCNRAFSEPMSIQSIRQLSGSHFAGWTNSYFYFIRDAYQKILRECSASSAYQCTYFAGTLSTTFTNACKLNQCVQSKTRLIAAQLRQRFGIYAPVTQVQVDAVLDYFANQCKNEASRMDLFNQYTPAGGNCALSR